MEREQRPVALSRGGTRKRGGVKIIDSRHIYAVVAYIRCFKDELCGQRKLYRQVPGFGVWLAEIKVYNRVVLSQKACGADFAHDRNKAVCGNVRNQRRGESARHRDGIVGRVG